MTSTAITALSVLGTVCAIVFGYVALMRNKKNDDAEVGEHKGTLLTEVGYIKSGIDDIKRKQEKQDEQHLDVVCRLTAVEESAKQAHLRINDLQKQ